MTRQGLKRLECETACGCLLYATLAQLERYGLPVCPCGARMVPEDLEVAAHVMDRADLETVPAWVEYAQQTSSVSRGQSPHVQRAMQSGRQVRPAEAVAADRIGAARKRQAHARRLSGLRQYVNAAQVAAEMPF